MFGHDPRVPIDIALGVEEDGPENEWVASHQERLHREFNQANQQLQTSAAARKTLFDTVVLAENKEQLQVAIAAMKDLRELNSL